MTVKELKEELNKLPDHCKVFIPNPEYHAALEGHPYINITHVSKGVNELDSIVILDNYEEDN